MPEDAGIQPSDARAMMRPREQIAPVAPFITPPLVAPRLRRRRLRCARAAAARVASRMPTADRERCGREEEDEEQQQQHAGRRSSSTSSNRQYGEEERWADVRSSRKEEHQ